MNTQKFFALVDCNNFYVSCERLFRPELNNRPVLVLSNNDGCVIARSNEVKALGVKMGTPYFKVRGLAQRHGVKVFSSNYSLYGDLSHRVMDVLQQLEPEVEIYSIDEAFLMLPGSRFVDLASHCHTIRERVRQCVGIPVSLGVAPTRTLAKVANQFAKKDPACAGVCCLETPDAIDHLLVQTGVGDVWGIGNRSVEKLRRRGIVNGLQLKQADDDWIRRQLTVSGLRTVMELRGVSCIEIDDSRAQKRTLVCSRSFGRPVKDLPDLREALSSYVSRVAEKLRAQRSLASSLHVFLLTNRFRTDLPQYSRTLTLHLPEPGSSTPHLLRPALKGLEQLFKTGYLYQKVGVMLTGLVPAGQRQLSLFTANASSDTELMTAMDQINRRWGRDTLCYGGTGRAKTWAGRQSFCSPAYTTRWEDLPQVGAGSEKCQENVLPDGIIEGS
ncbi:MAG: Y-family DNA polymerase [Desulfobulbaceae bacterium]|uniref:Y-family DNA polymerase n=1 Tax=Candidatus Desulfatifera sulfidica TaxID=2841691 RepID=A0A8J6NB18_9BACT|nr:Y-family DNA polymerase [Candidatus Desulfatifera sulfidica]